MLNCLWGEVMNIFLLEDDEAIGIGLKSIGTAKSQNRCRKTLPLKLPHKTLKTLEKSRVFMCCSLLNKIYVMVVQKRTITSLSIPQGIVYHQCEVLHIIKTLVLYIINPIVFDTHLKV